MYVYVCVAYIPEVWEPGSAVLVGSDSLVVTKMLA